MKRILYILTFLISGLAWGQADTAGVVFVANDWRDGHEGNVIKWVANRVYYQNGFDVYRQAQGAAAWEKLNEKAINVKSSVPTYLKAKDPDTEKLLGYVKDMKYEEFQTNLIRVFVAIKTVQEPAFAEVMGVVYYDETAQKGTNYRYKVVGNTLSEQETVNISDYIQVGPFQPIAPPQEITFERKKEIIDFKWKVETERYYGVLVYRKTVGQTEFVQITPEILNIRLAPNQNGEMTYPEVFFEDRDINNDLNYEYKLVGVDYFGQQTQFSEVLSFPAQDFEGPNAPYEVKADARLLGVEIKWKLDASPDAREVYVYRHAHSGDEKVRQNMKPLLTTDSVFTQEVADAGVYYYSVSCVDSAGNESFSEEIMLDVHDLIPPAIPQNVLVVADTGRISLQWDAVTDKDLMGYYVHRSLNDDNNEDNEFIVVNKEPIVGTTYEEVLPAKTKNKFVYKVVAVDSTYNRSGYSALSVVKLPDVTPPQAPFFKNIHTDHSNIKLKWLAYHESDLAGFYVYRSSAVDSSNYSKINKKDIGVDEVSYVDDNTTPGDKYYYYVVAVDSSGNQSEPSGVFLGMSDASENGAVNAHHDELAVTKVHYKVTKGGSRVKLSWKNPEIESFKGVVIYRGNSEKRLRPISGKISKTEFSDFDLEEGVLYYQIRSYDLQGHKSISKTLKVTIKG